MERLSGSGERRRLCVLLSTNVEHAVRGRSTLCFRTWEIGMRAYDLGLVVNNTVGKITCLDQYGDKIWIGTADGQVAIYQIEQLESQGTKPSFKFRVDNCKKIGRGNRVVEQIKVCNLTGKVVTLCDGYVDVLDWETLQLVATLPNVKGATFFCVERKSQSQRICTQQKRKLVLFHYADSHYEVAEELPFAEPILSMEWVKDRMWLGHKKEYCSVDLTACTVTTLVSLERAMPLVKMLEGELVLRVDNLGLFVGFDGQPTRPNISWTQTPTGLAYQFPYLVSLQPGLLEVHNIVTSTVVQAIPLPPNVAAVAIVDSSGQTEFAERILLASAGQIHQLHAVPIDEQVRELVNELRVKEALELLQIACKDDRNFSVKQKAVYRQAGVLFLRKLKFAQAFDLLKRSDADPVDILGFFPGLVPSAVLERVSQSAAGGDDVIRLVDERVAGMPPGERDIERERLLKEARTGLIGLLLEQRAPLVGAVRTATAPPASTIAGAAMRDRLRTIDTALVKLYVEVDPSGELIRKFVGGTECYFAVDELVPYLAGRNAHHSLALVYRAAHEDRKALEIWAKIGKGELSDRAALAAGHDGVGDTVSVLSQSSANPQLIWEYVPWVFHKSPKDGLKVFMAVAQSGGGDARLPDEQVLEFLARMGGALRQQYLEHLVFHVRVTEERLHTKLALLYLDQVLARAPGSALGGLGSGRGSVRLRAGDEPGELGEVRRKLLRLLNDSDFYNAAALLNRVRDTPLYEECVVLYSKLGQHHAALDMLANKLQDHERAEQYCKQYRPSAHTIAGGAAADETEPFLVLLKIYLEASNETDAIPPAAINLLTHHAAALPAAKVLPLLPSRLPVEKIAEYLTRSMRHTIHDARTKLIASNLEKSENLQTKAKAAKLKSRYVVITNDSVCPVCGKKIGDKVFACYPNGVVVHFKCFKDPHVCPVTGRNFLKSKLNRPRR